MEWLPIETAPKDGTTIRVAYIMDGEMEQHADMLWDDDASNSLFCPGVSGMWVDPGYNFTWKEDPEFGPTHWQPLPAVH